MGRFFRVSRNGRGLSLTPVGESQATVIEDPALVRVLGRVIGVFGGLGDSPMSQPQAFGAPAH
jgi:hypothetical protein